MHAVNETVMQLGSAGGPCRGRSHELSRNRETVADREHAELDARIVPEPGVEGAQGHGVLGAVVLVGHLPGH